jgi:hypothetical protein
MKKLESLKEKLFEKELELEKQRFVMGGKMAAFTLSGCSGDTLTF